MKHKLSYNYRMLQKMVLTPQMKQSLKFLSMSTQDLNEYIETALEANPFLKKEFSRKGTEYDPVAHIKDKENPRLALLLQAKILGLKDDELEIAEHLIYEMDDNGYVTVALEEMAQALLVDVERIEKVLEIIQSMEPAGIGARNVSECLQLQLKRAKKYNSLEYTIVTDFLSDVARNDIDRIAKVLHKNKSQVQSAVSNIKRLNPRPAGNMLSEEIEKITPDLVAEYKNKQLALRLNKDWMPQLKFYNPYANELDIAKDAEAKKFIKENMDSAKYIIDGLKRREQTIYKVASHILNFQIENIAGKENEIKTLTRNDVAHALGMHSSTISRTISHKYIQLDDEVMPLKAFLSKGMKKANGEITSKAAVRKKIEGLIKNENKGKPLTDEALKKALEKQGIHIKRRTIAKYRNSMRVLPAYLRKKKELPQHP